MFFWVCLRKEVYRVCHEDKMFYCHTRKEWKRLQMLPGVLQ